MALFVHLAPETYAARIRRGGIRRLRRADGHFPGGLFAVPVVRHFWKTHQWLRELKRWTHVTMVGVYFRVPDEQPVWLGHYNEKLQQMTAAQAASVFDRAEEPFGWEVVIPRRIAAKEIHKIRSLPQVIGWRYFPASKGRRPCGCDYCSKGEYGARKLRERKANVGG